MDSKLNLINSFLFAILIVNISMCSVVTDANAKYERNYQAEFCTPDVGIMEFKLDDKTRVDCLTEEYAIEIDFAKGGKHYNCLGQAMHYSAMTGKIGKCVLIVTKKSQMKNVEAIRNAIEYYKLNIELDIIGDYKYD